MLRKLKSQLVDAHDGEHSFVVAERAAGLLEPAREDADGHHQHGRDQQPFERRNPGEDRGVFGDEGEEDEEIQVHPQQISVPTASRCSETPCQFRYMSPISANMP